MELTPTTDQVVFQGDVLSLSCRVHKSDQHVRWFHDGRPFFADRRSGELQQSYRDPAHHGDIVSTIRLERLRSRHSGNWTCEARSSLGRTERFAYYTVCTSIVIVLYGRLSVEYRRTRRRGLGGTAAPLSPTKPLFFVQTLFFRAESQQPKMNKCIY